MILNLIVVDLQKCMVARDFFLYFHVHNVTSGLKIVHYDIVCLPDPENIWLLGTYSLYHLALSNTPRKLGQQSNSLLYW